MLAADPPNVEGARETARRTIRDGNRANEIVKRLRALFSKKDLTIESVDLNEAAGEVIALSSSEFQRVGVIWQADLADDLPLVRCDRVQLQQVVLNLLRNALDAMNLTTAAAARSMPRFKPVGFMPAATSLRPSFMIEAVSTVAVVVPSPALSLVLEATSRTI